MMGMWIKQQLRSAAILLLLCLGWEWSGESISAPTHAPASMLVDGTDWR